MNIKLIISCIVLLCLTCVSVSAETTQIARTIPITDDGLKPLHIAIHQQHLYVAEKTSISIYLLENGKRIKKIGRKGGGPGEFRYITNLFIVGETIVVNNAGGIALFNSKDGSFLRQQRTLGVFALSIIPIGQRFVGLSHIFENKSQFYGIHLYNSSEDEKILKKGKELFRMERPENPNSLNPIARYPDVQVYGDKIYFDNGNKSIFCYDENGRPVKTIKLALDDIPIPLAKKKEYRDYIKNHKRLKAAYQMYNGNIQFPGNYPPICFFQIDKEKIYVVTYRIVSEKSECVIYTLNGLKLRKCLIPIVFDELSTPENYTINDGTFYQLNENIEKEIWELNIFPI